MKKPAIRRPPDGIPATSDDMRLLHSAASVALVIAVAAVIAEDDVARLRERRGHDSAIPGESPGGGDATSMCSVSGGGGSANSVLVRGADGELSTHTLVDVSQG